jgi:hypothetical protein
VLELIDAYDREVEVLAWSIAHRGHNITVVAA